MEIAAALDSAGYFVEEAGTTEQATWLLRSIIPALVIAPYPLNMSGGDPFIVVLRTLPCCETIPVIALVQGKTAFGANNAAIAGADHECPHDVAASKLTAVVRNMIGRPPTA